MKREEKSAVSRQRILTAAMEEISRKGYEGASLSTLCAEKEISTLGELISAAEENMGNEPVPVRITDPKLDPDTMNRALQQVGGGYLYCGLNKDATAIVCSAPWNISMEDCLAALTQADALAESVVSQLITGDMSDLEKAEALYTWVTANVEYDQRYYSNRNAMPYESQTALGALRDGVAICGGYSRAVKLLFEKAGIPCFNVTGTCQGENHMWNIARIEGQFGFLRFALKELDRNKYQWDEAAISQLLK